MRLQLSQSFQQQQRLNATQRMGLTQLVLQLDERKHDAFPEAIRGFEGIALAHEILQEQNATGVLIGSLAERVWNQRRTKEELKEHKDVDVLVLSDHYKPTPFAQGIDWWLPQHAKEISYNDGVRDFVYPDATWHKNANDIILNYTISMHIVAITQLKTPLPGLYIMKPKEVSKIRELEAMANIDYDRVHTDIDSETVDKFREKIEKNMGTRLPRYMREIFSNNIVGRGFDYTQPTYIVSEGHDKPFMRAAHSYESKQKIEK